MQSLKADAVGAKLVRRRWPWSFRSGVVAVLLLWLLVAQAMAAVKAASLTFDEGPHLATGYATLSTGDLRLQPVHIHPPLANMLAAAPLMLDPDLPDPRAISGWDINSLSAVTDGLVWQNPRPAQLALAGRLPIILLTLIVGAVVLRWAADLGGAIAGLLALGLLTLDPNIVAHGALVTTDMAANAFGLLTFFLLHRYCHHSSRSRLLVVGLALGLALASKVSAVLLPPVVGAVLLAKGGRHGWQKSLLTSAAILLIAAATLWAIYGFELRPIPDVTGSIPVPAATHWQILRSLQEHYRLGHPAFLMGRNSDQGWWVYFPVAFAIKTPLPTLILLGSALIIVDRRRLPLDITLTLYPVAYLLASLFSSVNIGYRHLLPVLPFIYILIGYALSSVIKMPVSRTSLYASRGALVALILWLVVGMALVFPYPLTFFNELAGGPDGGYRWLVDSNLDWGQNLWQLRDWMRAEGVERVYYSHFSPARTEVYGVTIDWLPPDPRTVPFAAFDPSPGVYAIGATTLQGVYAPDVNTFSAFRSREPDTVLGHAMFVYRVPEGAALDWAAVCFDVPLSAQEIRVGFGQPDLRLVYFDCAQSLVYPGHGEGRYVLPPDADWPEAATPALKARHADGTPAYSVLRSIKRPLPQTSLPETTIDGPLAFLGYRTDRVNARAGDDVVFQTFWQVEQTPDRPLSLMAHLVSDTGTLIAVGDGLGVPVEGWRPGDQIVQTHRLTLPLDVSAAEYTLQTGAYWLETLERWPVRHADGTLDDHISVDKITIVD